MLVCRYLRRIVGPLPIHKELVLMLSFRQIQDGYKVILAAEREEAVFQLGGLLSGCRRADMFNNSPSVSTQESHLRKLQARVSRKLHLLRY